MTIINQRMTAIIDKPIVVFLIGMRINRPWKFHQWYPVASAMPRMLKELEGSRTLGFLGGAMWGGRTSVMVQYWESFDALERYARERDNAHLPAWREFNRRIASGGDVGIWHETYLVNPGQYECVYHNMPPFGLGRVGRLVEASGALSTARGRLQRA
jgi:hypothetical protein